MILYNSSALGSEVHVAAPSFQFRNDSMRVKYLLLKGKIPRAAML